MPKASERATQLAREVLAKIAAYDPYFPKPNPATLNAWAEHISMVNPNRDDMLAAVTKFYEKNTEGAKPLPAAITSVARQMRQDRMARNDYTPPPNKSAEPDVPELPGAKKISMAEWEKLHGQSFPKLVLGDLNKALSDANEAFKASFDGPNPLRVSCDYCHVGVGSPCIVPGTNLLLTQVRAHESRIAKAEQRCGGMHHESPHTQGCDLA